MFSRRLLILILTAAEFGCKKETQGPKPRYAVLRFENLSGDPALDWTGRAASAMLPVTLAGAMDGPLIHSLTLAREGANLGLRPQGAPGVSSERSEALLAGATRLITGYITAVNGKVRITAVVENAATGKVSRTVSAEETTPFAALRALGVQLSPQAKPYLTPNGDVVRLYATAIDEDGSQFARRKDELQQALALDPNFGPAWIAMVQTHLFQGDAAGADQTLAQGLSGNLDPRSRTILEEEAAERHNDKPAIIAAERKLLELSPGDTILLRGLAEREMSEGRFAEAAADWKKLSDILTGDPAVMNSLGYARLYAGDYAGSLQAFQGYEKLRPNDPNVEDSIGDLDYSFHKFSDAAKRYQQAYAKDPNFLRGGDLYKAAWAKFRAGDATGANTTFAQFRNAREKLNDPTIVLLDADWLYRTGRTAEAVALLRRAVANTTGSPQLRAIASAQLAVWDLLAGDRAKAMADAAAIGPPTSAPLAIVRFAAQPSASAEEWKVRAGHAMQNPGLAQLRNTVLAYALLLDGKPKDALPYWQEVVQRTPATDWFSRAILDGIEGRKPLRALLPDPTAVNQFAALPDRDIR